MNSQLLGYYNRELQHLRGMAGEFAKEFPKIAGRLSLDEYACADPYVERLLEGFAFLAARVHLKLDAEFPRFTQAMLETVYPHYLCPTPSMATVQLSPDMAEGSLTDGYEVERGTALRSVVGKDDRTACEYRTAHAVTLWPIEVVEAQYCTRELGTLGITTSGTSTKAGIRLRLKTGGEQTFADLATDSLTFHLRGAEDLPMRIYEQIFAHATGVVAQPVEKPHAWQHTRPATSIHQVGFSSEEALLPNGARSFHGYRLLQEYFSFPQRFLFFRLNELQDSIRACNSSLMDVIILLDEENLHLENQLDASHFALHCTPIINLFPKRADRIHISKKTPEFHVLPDRTRPMDFEVYQVLHVTGYGLHAGDEQPFRSFYSETDFENENHASGAYFAVNRMPRLMSSREKQKGRRSNYGGSEVFLSLVDAHAAPYRSDLRQLGVETLCTNRDLPIQMPVGRGSTDFTMETSAPVSSVRCMAGPTAPRASHAEGETSWRIINHLSLNYLSIVDSGEAQGAAALRDLLRLYGNAKDPQIYKQIEGVVSVSSKPIRRRIVADGPIAFARGVEITTTFDETAFEGTGVFLLGAVLDVFFAKYVSINSFTESVVRSQERGEIVRWPTRIGLRHTL